MTETLEEEIEDKFVISLNSLLGLNSSDSTVSTIKIVEYAMKLPITVLMDSYSTHAFIDPHIVKMLRLPFQPMKRL